MIDEKQAINLLKKYADSDEIFQKVLAHSLAVKKAALEIASRISGIDMNIIRIGSLLHDIGRLRCGPGCEKTRHGLIGAEILRKEGLPEIACVAERHIGIGIMKEDVIKQGLTLPERDFVPITREEKIIAYADNFIFDDICKNYEDVEKRFRNELGPDHVRRLRKMKKEIEEMD